MLVQNPSTSAVFDAVMFGNALKTCLLLVLFEKIVARIATRRTCKIKFNLARLVYRLDKFKRNNFIQFPHNPQRSDTNLTLAKKKTPSFELPPVFAKTSQIVLLQRELMQNALDLACQVCAVLHSIALNLSDTKCQCFFPVPKLTPLFFSTCRIP